MFIYSSLKNNLPFLMILAGIGAISFAFFYDLLEIGGQEGFGKKQIAVVLFGVMLVTAGIFSYSSIGKLFFKEVSSPSRKNGKPVSILMIAFWFGLVTGLGEVSILAFRNYYNGQPIFLSHHFPWIVPVADVLVFVIPGLLLYLIFQDRLEKRSLQFTIFLLAFFSFLSWLLMFSRLHILASLLLGIGLAAQIMRMISSRPDRFYSLVRLTIGLLGSLVIMIAAIMLIFFP